MQPLCDAPITPDFRISCLRNCATHELDDYKTLNRLGLGLGWLLVRVCMSIRLYIFQFSYGTHECLNVHSKRPGAQLMTVDPFPTGTAGYVDEQNKKISGSI